MLNVIRTIDSPVGDEINAAFGRLMEVIEARYYRKLNRDFSEADYKPLLNKHLAQFKLTSDDLNTYIALRDKFKLTNKPFTIPIQEFNESVEYISLISPKLEEFGITFSDLVAYMKVKIQIHDTGLNIKGIYIKMTNKFKCTFRVWLRRLFQQ